MFIRAAMTACFLLLSSLGSAEEVKSPKPIGIVINDWSSQIVFSHIVGTIFQSMGYNVVYIPSSTHDQWGLLRFGLADVQLEVWEGTMSEMFNRFVEYGSIIDAGSHDAITREDWWYPSYVEAHCPGLPDWKALKKCASVFATEDTAPKGRYLAGPWEKPDKARIRALGLRFIPVQVEKTEELWAALHNAVRQQRPIVMFNWTPNWVESRVKGAFIEFPQWDEKCETEPVWGENKVFLHDCGNPRKGWLKKAASVQMENTWSCAFETLKQISADNRMLSQLAAMVDVDKVGYRAAAVHWINKNATVWRSWIPAHCVR